MSVLPEYHYTKKAFSFIGYASEDYDHYWSEVNLRKWMPRMRINDYAATDLLYPYPFSTNDIKIEQISTEGVKLYWILCSSLS